ncbi:MAG TPA: HAD-IC family P-type ATPase [Acidimicrobiia bacterium]|nr:HAD-IC family P-type ATPase [Acidimicrobiia bacterium]
MDGQPLTEPGPGGSGLPDESWHTLEVSEVEDRLRTGARGLSSPEATARLSVHGPNRLEEEPPPSALVVFVRQFRSPLIFILLAAMAVTLLLAEYLDSVVIGVVLLLNAVIGFFQERKAEGAVRALMQLVVPVARVIRDGQDQEIDSRELVVGDVVLLESGVRVPADLRLVSTSALRIDESLLTGESVPVSKGVEPVPADALLPDRSSMAYTGAVVTSGRGAGVVVATANSTELGSIAGLVRAEGVTETPLQRRMDRFARIIGAAVGVAAVVVFVSGLILDIPLQEIFLVAVAVAVSAVPEGLPVAVTITLTVGVSRMAKRKAIVRRLPAVETLGSTTVIGSDKTGTLTMNRMSVQEVWTPESSFQLGGDGQSQFTENGLPVSVEENRVLRLNLLTGVLTNEADVYTRAGEMVVSGDPTEVALLFSAMSGGVEPRATRTANPVFAEIPFEPERQYSASVRSSSSGHRVFVKGAPERIISMCSEMMGEDGPIPLDPRFVNEAAANLAGRGHRVLAFAYRELPNELSEPGSFSEPGNLTLVGLQGMIDPPRQGVREAVAACQEAGIRVVMITGDHALTAETIARQLGIGWSGGGVLTGAEMGMMDDEELTRRLVGTSVFARVSPEDKLRIVNLFKAQGEVVAVTGDGVNDAPALKAAEIGVAMGEKGTDVAREASDMVLADDNFVTIVAAVEEGRVTFDNIRKVTFFLVSTGAAEIAAILTAVWLQWPLVFLPAQLLWLNLVTNGLQDIALAFEPAERDVLRRRPRPRGGGVLDRRMWERVVVAGLVMAAGALVTFRWELDLTGSLTRAQTVALTTMVVYQVFQAGNARSETESVFRVNPFSNKLLLASTTAALGIHIAALYFPPTQFLLRVEPIEPAAWLRIVIVALSILVAMEAHKLIRRARTGAGAGASAQRTS